jgi:hypothetical protein
MDIYFQKRIYTNLPHYTLDNETTRSQFLYLIGTSTAQKPHTLYPSYSCPSGNTYWNDYTDVTGLYIFSTGPISVEVHTTSGIVTTQPIQTSNQYSPQEAIAVPNVEKITLKYLKQRNTKLDGQNEHLMSTIHHLRLFVVSALILCLGASFISIYNHQIEILGTVSLALVALFISYLNIRRLIKRRS